MSHRKLKSIGSTGALVSLFGLVTAVALAATPVPEAQLVTSGEFAAVRISDTVAMLPNQAIFGEIDRDTLFDLASKEVDASLLAKAQIFRGTASQFMEDAPRSVLVVVVPGGIRGSDGPLAAATTDIREARVTGLVFDAQTGEFLRGFLF